MEERRHGRRGVRVAFALFVSALLLACTASAAQAAEEPDPGRTKTFTYDAGGDPRPYILYTPTSYSRSHPAPLLVMAHGCQTTAEEQMRASLFNGLAERHGFVVLYPDVDVAETQQPGPLRNCWKFYDSANWSRDSADPTAIAEMTREVMARRRIDQQRVYLAGISAGGFTTSIMAAAYPDLYAAVVIAAGGEYGDPGCLFVNTATRPVDDSAAAAYAEMGSQARVVPRLVMGGDADQGVPPQCADKALEQGLRTNNLVISGSQDGPIALTPSSVKEAPPPGADRYGSTVSTYTDPDGCVIGERWLIHGMNHFWPGGSSDPEWANFTDPKGPSGARITWRFLSRYTKRSTAMPCAEADEGDRG
jgi:poly(hydroxyalkanoate) depolymerase family esterase